MALTTSLQGLERTVQALSEMPGERIIALVSPGFLSQSEQGLLDRIVSRALRSQVVISSLDPKGLALLMRGSDASSAYAPGGMLALNQHDLDSNREAAATEVLAEVAQGTGGEFFHGNNNLRAGFGAFTGAPVSYILAFAPRGIKPDGKFHALKVTLAEKRKGISVQARSGYFAPASEAEDAAAAKEVAASDAEAQLQERIWVAMFSKVEFLRFPVALNAKISKGPGEEVALSLFARLDARLLRVRKEREHNVDMVTFVSAVFDQEDNLVDFQRRQLRVSVVDSQLPGLFAAGVDSVMTFQLKPAAYRVREVVADSEGRQMTAFSYNIKIPSER